MKMLTKNFSIIALAALAVFMPQNAHALSAAAQQIQGEVQIAKASAPETWAPITADTALENGDSIKTGAAGSCVLVYTDQASFSVEPNTTLTVEERADAEDIKLLLGNIKGKVNKQNAQQPFVVTTPAAVATVRGTEVDFGFNDKGEMTVDLHTGAIQVVNEAAEMTLDLDGQKSITIFFDKDANLLRFKNGCGSSGPVTFKILGTEYSEDPCGEKEISLATAEQGTTGIDTNTEPGEPENPDEGRTPVSEFNA